MMPTRCGLVQSLSNFRGLSPASSSTTCPSADDEISDVAWSKEGDLVVTPKTTTRRGRPRRASRPLLDSVANTSATGDGNSLYNRSWEGK